MTDNNEIRVNGETRIDFDNTAEKNICINVSKAKLIYKKFFGASHGEAVWGWLGAALACWPTALAGEFQDVAGIEGSGRMIRMLFFAWRGGIKCAIGSIDSKMR